MVLWCLFLCDGGASGDRLVPCDRLRRLGKTLMWTQVLSATNACPTIESDSNRQSSPYPTEGKGSHSIVVVSDSIPLTSVWAKSRPLSVADIIASRA